MESENKKHRHFLINLLDIRSGMMEYDELERMMEENTVIHGANMWILIMAILIASIGLNVDSTAVIIGAMLVSPLMSGILTMGYSLATSNLTMLKKAFIRFCIQVLISLITSTIYFFISPLDIPTDEMIARTSPNLWDVLVALFGGIAGGIGNTRKEKSNVIPGVAIATALMPPLCTVGYGLATMKLRFIFGAFYLFVINTLFIMLSTSLVTKLLRVPLHEDADERKHKKVRHLIAIITVLTVAPSILIGTYKVYQTVMEQNIDNYLKNEFKFKDAQVVHSKSDILKREIAVSIVGTQIPDDVIERLKQELEQYNLQGYTLSVTQNRISDSSDEEKVTISIQENTIKELQQQVEEQQEKIDDMSRELSNQIDCKEISEKATQIFGMLSDCCCGIMSGTEGEYILFTGKAKTPLSEDEEQILRNWIMAESNMLRVELQIGQ